MDALTGRAGDERVALLRLAAIPGVGPRRLRQAVEARGSARAVLAAPAPRRAELLRVRAAEPGSVREARRLLEACTASRVVALSWNDPSYPARLLHLYDPPPLLFVRGDPSVLSSRHVAMVGARAASDYGRRVARRFAAEVAGAGVVVVSGMARGIDAAAHFGALEAGGRSVAVVGSGPERAHPRLHTRLHRDLARTGAVCSEYPPGTPVRAHHFPARNRIMAALSSAVLVVEAGDKSGALITVDHATALGRPVLAVPGPIDRATSRGTNRLVRDGAVPALSAGDVLEAMGVDDVDRTASPPDPGRLGADAERVWIALDGPPADLDHLTLASGLDAARALTALTRLELGGWVERHAGQRFARRS